MILISLHPNQRVRNRANGVSPEVGDLQRSSEALEPSLESPSAEGAAEFAIKHSGIKNIYIYKNLEVWTKAMTLPTHAHTHTRLNTRANKVAPKQTKKEALTRPVTHQPIIS